MLSDTAAEARQRAREEAGYACCALGIDPGPIPGFFLAAWAPGHREAALALAWQCRKDEAPGLLAMILDWYGALITCGQAEEFRGSLSPGSRGKHATATRSTLSVLTSLAEEHGVRLAVRHSSRVMPWATDKKLKTAGLYEATTGKKDARAASRHALYCAVHDGGLPDPLSARLP